MLGIRATLFGKFNVERNDQHIDGIEAGKVRELLGFLILHRNQPQPRETLAEAIWEGQPPERSRKYLRQTLWKLNCALEGHQLQDSPAFLIDPEWIQLNPAANWCLDVDEFERIYAGVKDKRAGDLSADEFLAMEQAAELYKDELLKGWYQDWCLYERERVQVIYLMLLTKLIQYCEINRQVEAGLIYGEKLLRYDPAYERAHRQMMRLYFLAGDRTQALRQYARCVTALHEELDVEPSERTSRLYEQIKTDRISPGGTSAADKNSRLADASLKGSLESQVPFEGPVANIQP